MFGYVTANFKELTKEQQLRYSAVYCGICRAIREEYGQLARLGLRYDMAFLALLLMSLYEPEEGSGTGRCLPHPGKARLWVTSPYIRYAAAMNVALAYYNCLDDWQDDKKLGAKLMADALEKQMPKLRQQYPAQCQAMEGSIRELSVLEKEKCGNPDKGAAAFGRLMAALLAPEEDLWKPTLEKLGDALGRFIYLLDAAVDYDRDQRRHKYNPYLAMGMEKDPQRWREYLVLTMGRATQAFELLPLVQDKPLLDNILYSGVWVQFAPEKKGGNQP